MKKNLLLFLCTLIGTISSNYSYKSLMQTYCTKKNLISSSAGIIAIYALYKSFANFREASNNNTILEKRKVYDELFKQYNLVKSIDMPVFQNMKLKNYICGSCWLGLATVSGIASWHFAKKI